MWQRVSTVFINLPSLLNHRQLTVCPHSHLQERYFARLEVIQWKIGRLALGANECVAVAAIRGDMGWSTSRERIEKEMLWFIGFVKRYTGGEQVARKSMNGAEMGTGGI